MSRLKELVQGLQALLADKIGTFDSTNTAAIAVAPGYIPDETTGIRCVVQAQPITTGQKVSGGTYYPNVYLVELIQFIGYLDYSTDFTKANELIEVIRLIENAYDVQRTRYSVPSERSYERVLIEIFLPEIST